MRPPFINIFWRSFFIQAHWNYARMQGTGFLFCLLPAARKFFRDPKLRIEFLKRHSRFFNAQPYCASLALGQVLRRELIAAQSDNPVDEATLESTVQCKDGLCGPLGLLGDQLFWQLLKPTTAAMGILAALLLGGNSLAAGLAGAGVFLLLFNPLHLWMRWWGLKTGYYVLQDLPGFLSTGVLPKWRRRLAAIGPYIAAGLAAAAFTHSRREFAAGWLVFPVSFVWIFAALKLHRSVHLALCGVAALALLIALSALNG